MANDKFKNISYIRAFNQTGDEREIHLQADEIDTNLLPETFIGVLKPQEFISYAIYTGGTEIEFLSEIRTIDEDMNMLSEQEIADLQDEKVDSSSLPQDGFIVERIDKFNFKKDEWELANEHLGQTVTNQYYYFDNNDSFLTLLSKEREKRLNAKPSEGHTPA